MRAGVPADLLTGRDAQERQLEETRAEATVDEAAHELKVKQIELDEARRAARAR